ncbi:MAG: DUF465 domain-containing protein [Gammaproteobacteria bacterium]|nr:DUF465 domain-containing protein [Gammaproteobacteria bacterium]
MSNDEELDALRARIDALRVEHRDLDDVIGRLGEQPFVDELRVRRLKKRRLLLKDMLTSLESRLIPDIDA